MNTFHFRNDCAYAFLIYITFRNEECYYSLLTLLLFCTGFIIHDMFTSYFYNQ